MLKQFHHLVLLWLLSINSIAYSEDQVDLQMPPDENGGQKLSGIVIDNRQIFEHPQKPGPKLINFTHWVTRKGVIAREVWLQPGDPITDADLNELERNLRALNLFAEVNVSTQASNSGDDFVDLVIKTRDKLSFLGVAGGTFLGGIGEVGFLLNENNLWGLGHQLQYRYVENTEKESLGTLSYENIYLGRKDIYAGIKLGQTNDGESASIKLENRFQNFDDSLSWKIELTREAQKQDYFEEGESVIQVPREDEGLVMERTTHLGQRDSSWKFGLNLTFDRTKYQDAQGTQANTIDIPENEDTVFAGVLVGRQKITEHRKVIGMDTLSFVQDLSLGYNLELLAGINRRETATQRATLPVVFFNASNTNAISTFNYFNTKLNSILSVDENQLETWNIDTGFTWFNTRFDHHTTAARTKYTSGFNRSGLPPQQILGEDNGLRGYPAREFSGEQLLLLNLEHRFKTKLNFASIELGSVVFFDAGWVGDRGSSRWLDNAQTSTGVGFRFGSPQLLGSSVVRLDIAQPLNDHNGKSYTPTFSVAVGQVFGFNP